MNDARDWPYLKPAAKLAPADAAVVLITDETGRYLMQLRDAKPTIFFPDHWGCFGGALEPGESDEEAARRELQEELAIALPPEPLQRFTTFTFDFAPTGGDLVRRTYFELRVDAAILPTLKLGEGQRAQFQTAPDVLREQVVPYDRFAIWMHHYRRELSGAAGLCTTCAPS